ncbi:MAG: nicotinamide-nucleotide amidohydrolase family protein [Spirochaetales bacterium]|nr:nicotinamide-nucleotide amidohydrolase family protein [Spirochaetales bacterium]
MSLDDAGALLATLADRRLKLAGAESCTGGLVAAALTAVPGSSDSFMGTVVAYANAAKVQMLGVQPDLLAAHGAVSRECAMAMAEGAAKAFGADLAYAITGVAGPGGGTPDKPVGTVWLGLWLGGDTQARRLSLSGDRAAIREAAARSMLDWLSESLSDTTGAGLHSGNRGRATPQA